MLVPTGGDGFDQRRMRPTGMLVGAALAGLLVSCAAPALTVDLPAKWVEMSGAGVVELRSDGTGDVSEFPVPGDGPCSLRGADRYTGPIEWEPVSEGRFVIPSSNGDVLVGADLQVGSQNWGKLVVLVCGLETPAGDQVMFSGGPEAEW